ncbi:MAG TPA: cytochrome c biogenesis protein CcdA [Nocardioidaceae bacterium]|nr:cytochrome c biogenesis protein CcdA [Nocardioidaceae bacterium]
MGGLADWFVEQVNTGSLVLAVPVAATAGLVSFFSPCVVPLLPGYISYATGLSGADLENARRSRMVAGTSLFVAGFTFVFMVQSLFFGAVGEWLFKNTDTINVVLGIATIILGLVFIGVTPFLQRDVRVHKVPAVGLGAAPLLGVLFALGWTPCIGPTLGAVSLLAYNEGTAGRGLILGLAYSLGLGVPFILAGLMFERTLGAVRWVRRHQVWVTRLGGGMLIVVGLLLVTGLWAEWISQLQGWASSSETSL